jgi:hypothetical protein
VQLYTWASVVSGQKVAAGSVEWRHATQHNSYVFQEWPCEAELLLLLWLYCLYILFKNIIELSLMEFILGKYKF